MLSTPTVPPESMTSPVMRRHGATDLENAIHHVLCDTQHACRARERRRQQRIPYPYLVRLSPVESDGHTPAGEDIVVVGKHLSPGGFDFYHRDPLPYRWIVACLESGAGRLHRVLVELLWCRFNTKGWYVNGGRFLRLVDATPQTAMP